MKEVLKELVALCNMWQDMTEEERKAEYEGKTLYDYVEEKCPELTRLQMGINATDEEEQTCNVLFSMLMSRLIQLLTLSSTNVNAYDVIHYYDKRKV